MRENDFIRKHQNLLLASSVSFTAREWYLHHTGGESDPQSVTLAIYLHADDALVLHTIDTAPRKEREDDGEQDKMWIILYFLKTPGLATKFHQKVGGKDGGGHRMRLNSSFQKIKKGED